MRRTIEFLCIVLLLQILVACIERSPNPPGHRTAERLREWRKGVWAQGNGSFTIYTDSHYFVVSSTGDSASLNLYVGASQIVFHDKGIARKQILRLRQMPGGSLQTFCDSVINQSGQESPLIIDTALFVPGSCTLKEGILYDAVMETTDTSITMSTCNGDREIVYQHGLSRYLPAGGGEAYSVRIEKL